VPLSSETFNSKEKEFCIIFDVASLRCFCPDWWKEVFFGEIRLYQRERGFSQAVAQVNLTAQNTFLLVQLYCLCMLFVSSLFSSLQGLASERALAHFFLEKESAYCF
jgi:hypothetical protein